MRLIQEGKAKIEVSDETLVSKKLPVFYNPIMKLNRDISVKVLSSEKKEGGVQIALPLAGSGIRGIRFLLELDNIKTVFFNDLKSNFKKTLKSNFKLNKISLSKNSKNSFYKKVQISNNDANIFLLQGFGFDYIDLDPFGSPNPFLDASIRRISRGGILAVTATDTSALAGTYPDACRRKYWAKPLRNELKHEIGLRILIRKVQLIGAQFEKSLTPILSYSSDHYVRVFLRCEKGKKKVDKVLDKHGEFLGVGPMWLGLLWDKTLLKKILIHKPKIEDKSSDKSNNLIKLLLSESNIGDVVGFYDIHAICKQNKLIIPSQESLFEKIKSKGFKASRTHFSPVGIRSNIDKKALIRIIKSLNK